MGSLDLIQDHTFVSAEGLQRCGYHYPSQGVCTALEEEHLLGSKGDILPHAWVGPAGSEGRVGANTECQLLPCGMLRLARVHGDRKPEYLPTPPMTEVVGDIPEPVSVRLGLDPLTVPKMAMDIIPAVQAWDALSAQVRDTILAKSRGYGNAWQEQGYMGNLARVLSKTSRLKNLLWRDGGPDMSVDMDGGDADPEAESVLDTLLDLSALCALAVANIEEGNKWGR